MKKFLLLCAAMCSMGSLMAAAPEAATPAQKRATIMRLNDENPNSCLVVTEMFFEQDSIPTYKTDYEYDSNRELSAMYNYEMVDTGWFCYSYGFYEYLYLPNDTTNIGYTHNWDYELNTWEPTVGHKTQELTNGNIVLQQSWETLPGDTTQWVLRSKYQTTYDEAKRVIESISYSDVDGQLEPSYKSEYAYAEDGEQILSISYTWMDGEWKTYEKDEIIRTDTSYFKGSYSHDEDYTTLVLTNSVYERYDADGNKIYYVWGGNVGRVYLEENYTYENGLLQSQEVYREGQLTERHFFQYDDANRVIEDKFFSYNYGYFYIGYRTQTTYVSNVSDLISCTLTLDSLSYDEQWYPNSKREFNYTPSGLTTLDVTSSYNRDEEAWVYTYKSEVVYNDEEWELYSANYSWNAELNMWHGDYKHETEYNEEGVPVSSISYIMYENDTVWVPEHAVVRMFDLYGNFLGEGWYGLDKETGAWVNLGKQLFVYICGDIPTPAQPVVVDPGHDFVTFAWLSYENANTYTLTVLSASMTDTIAIMNFNSFGELISVESPANAPRRSQAMASSSSVFSCQIEGLETATNYHFVLEVKDEQEQVKHTEQGNFHTEGFVSALEQIQNVVSDGQKVLVNGTLLIQMGDHWYNAQGQQVR